MSTRMVPLSQFDRIVDSFFSPSRTRLARQIPLDALQRDDKLVLIFDLPGVSEEAIEMSLERRQLTVKAERPSYVQDSDIVFVADRPWGEMTRQILLGDTLDLERVAAHFENGVLTVTVPVAATARTRRIEIGHAPVDTQATTEESPST